MADGSDSPVKGRKSRKVEDPPPSFALLKGIASLTGVKSTFPTDLPAFAIDKYFVVHPLRPFPSLSLCLPSKFTLFAPSYWSALPSPASTWTNAPVAWPSGVPPVPTTTNPASQQWPEEERRGKESIDSGSQTRLSTTKQHFPSRRLSSVSRFEFLSRLRPRGWSPLSEDRQEGIPL